MVSYATLSDLPELCKLGKKFSEEANSYACPFVPTVWVSKWAKLIESGVGFILKAESDGVIVGSLGFIAVEDLNDGNLVANEAFWFVLPEARGRGFELLIKYEEEARGIGCSRCSMIHLEKLQPEKLGKLYLKRGYEKMETSYFKQLI